MRTYQSIEEYLTTLMDEQNIETGVEFKIKNKKYAVLGVNLAEPNPNTWSASIVSTGRGKTDQYVVYFMKNTYEAFMLRYIPSKE